VKEQELFDYLKGTHFPDLEKSEGVYDSFDCSTNEKNLYIELKCRHTHYPDLLIEEMKYRRLINQAGSLTPYYINSTPVRESMPLTYQEFQSQLGLRSGCLPPLSSLILERL
jgi:hypothetical protein